MIASPHLYTSAAGMEIIAGSVLPVGILYPPCSSKSDGKDMAASKSQRFHLCRPEI